MDSWVYIFSKFTPEALLFEGMIICALSAGYAAFWVLKKRKYGVAGQEVPSNLVKGYLSALIADAEQMRAQLFGLLKSAGVNVEDSLTLSANSQAIAAALAQNAQAGAVAADPAVIQKVQALEAKMAEQTKAMQTLEGEKVKIEKELQIAKTASKNPAAQAAESGTAVAELQAKIKLLEGKLAEYSVIEDDLANLKRLQQENTQLKTALSGGTLATSATSAGPAVAAPAKEAIPSPEVPKAEEPASQKEADTAESAVAQAKPAQAETPSKEPALDAAFEGLVNEVEKSLEQPEQKTEQKGAEEPAKAEEAAAAGLEDLMASLGGPETQAATPAEPAANEEQKQAASAAESGQSDADLVAEFEKMLNA